MALQLYTKPREVVEHVCPLPHFTGAVSAVRRQARAVLADWNVCPEIVDDALLVVTELVTNAIVHAVPPAELRMSWVCDDGLGTLRIEVTDAGRVLPTGQSPAGIDPDEHGRGEEIVHALATRHGIHVHSGRITRWADLLAA
ncbi:hypothetical protein GCM10011579_002780 [Streptomyces albiflavescens]|uniref:Histidine kinase/HSP90-like ATPase domain-containing protein n=1 Tax=Streptomyces albiflavescens TaxID=1623582 RepID=A0A918CYH0_9ACTN|nr:ATP-binding protein [Streptomyces albiflavescens]GGN49239.1 hypothetical protein GCM10011579_002780 [Streptomyces albiflavescens]